MKNCNKNKFNTPDMGFELFLKVLITHSFPFLTCRHRPIKIKMMKIQHKKYR